MERRTSAPREGWREKVERVGLVYPVTDRPDGTQTPYWFESATYAFTPDEVEHLEAVTEELHAMCLAAVDLVLDDPQRLRRFNLDPDWAPFLRASRDEPSVYGRFDLAYRDRASGPAKLLEYNADTATGLVESSVAQWYWLQDVHSAQDQWNSLHERLLASWRRHATALGPELHFAHSGVDTSGEEWMTVAYMRDVAIEAGYLTYGLEVEQIGWDSAREAFVGLHGEPISACFMLYPWEDMLTDRFGPHVLASAGSTRWVEPAWKVLLSNKALLPTLWEMYAGHPNLLPAFFDHPHGMTSYVAKPLHGREGDGIRVVTPTHREERPSVHYGPEGYVYQQWHELPSFDGNHAVLGAWVVDGSAAGVGVRESDGPVTDYYARFVPHVIDGPVPSPQQIEEWLHE